MSRERFMHPALDHSLTFRELQVRVAEMDGATDESGTAVGPPTDAIALDKVKRAINDAAVEIARKASWLWLRQTIVITMAPDGDAADSIDADATRYALPPQVVSAPYGRVTWKNADATDGGKVFSTSTDQLLYLAARDPNTTGAPRYVSVQPAYGVNTPAGSRPRMELRVWPKPAEAYTITCEFSVTPVPLVNDSDRGIWPPYMDMPVVRRAFAGLLKYSDAQFSIATQEADKAIAEARAHEGENRNRRLGRMGMGLPDTVYVRPESPITIPDIGFTMT